MIDSLSDVNGTFSWPLQIPWNSYGILKKKKEKKKKKERNIDANQKLKSPKKQRVFRNSNRFAWNSQIINSPLTIENDSDWMAKSFWTRHNSRRTTEISAPRIHSWKWTMLFARLARRNVWMKFCGLLARLIVARLLRFRRERSFRSKRRKSFPASATVCIFVI